MNEVSAKAKAAGLPRRKGRKYGDGVYTAEKGVLVCERLAEGKTLKELCAPENEWGLPSTTTIFRWLNAEPEFQKGYEAALLMKADLLVDEATDMARELRDERGTSERVQAYRVAMEHLRWTAARLHPKNWGEKAAGQIVVPIQINTNLNLGQAGGDTLGEENAEGSGVWRIQAEIPVNPDQEGARQKAVRNIEENAVRAKETEIRREREAEKRAAEPKEPGTRKKGVSEKRLGGAGRKGPRKSEAMTKRAANAAAKKRAARAQAAKEGDES